YYMVSSMFKKISIFLFYITVICITFCITACDSVNSGLDSYSNSVIESEESSTSSDESENLEISLSDTLNATINDTEIYLFADYTTTTINLSRNLTCPSNCSWKLYAGNGITEIATKILSLSDGNNTFYVVVTSKNDDSVSVTYTISVYKSFAVTVNYYKGTTLLHSETAYTGYTYTSDYIPDTDGFDHWETSEGKIYSADIIYDNLDLYVYINGQTHTYSTQWSYDEVAHWHGCLDEDCDTVSDYEEHIPADEGSSNGGYVYYTCEVCGAMYRAEVYTYIAYVTNIGGAGVSGVSVTLYNESGTALSTISSGSSGAVRFRNLEAGNYTAKIDESTIPIGYSYNSKDLTIEFTADYRTETFTLTPHLITDAEMPSGTVYSLGSVVYDFEVTAYYPDGASDTIKLSEYLAKYNAVVIQFCLIPSSITLSEFPYINQAYNSTIDSYYQKIGLIEFAYTGQVNLEGLQNYIQDSYGYDNFTYVYDTGNYYANYNVGYFPTTVVIDKYGVVAQIDVGSNLSFTYWNSLFEYYSSDDYVPNYAT
ncbi:MAG: hypothetical protein LUI60_05535, partial [Clostridia bacterium]|nr:hypothetical protein [Clostridia bacterium]